MLGTVAVRVRWRMVSRRTRKSKHGLILLNTSNIKTTIERYKKASSDSSNMTSITEINAQHYQQESAKLRQQIQMLQNSNRHLMGDSLSALSVKELKQLENRLERGITRIRSKKHEMLLAEIEYLQKKVLNHIYICMIKRIYMCVYIYIQCLFSLSVLILQMLHHHLHYGKSSFIICFTGD
ncbi:agamous-like MADS-box protein AGL11 isoform X2 [Punica granatum]|uniref:Agamous-like MADS-box protein AGL11 isoform X2 n=2 Tax=Punica granatum TaxID=22663 RepID=A0A6P8DQE1_PUNGR|nr:agamous-like MADS-box protein AGL11 isoform X2 [Punica granatum]